MNQQIGDILNSVLHNVNTNQTKGIEKQENRFIDKSITLKYSCLRHLSFYVFIANLVCLGFNMYYIFNWFPRIPDNLSFDYMGVIVGILSFLVTLLIGWNIFSVIDFNKKVEEIIENNNKLKEEGEAANKQFLKIKNDLQHLQANMTFQSILNNVYNNKDREYPQYIIDGYIDALNVAIRDELEEDRIEVVIDMLHHFIKPNNTISILQNRRDFYCDILDKIHPKSDSVYFIIDSIKNKSKEADENIPPLFLRVASEYNLE